MFNHQTNILIFAHNPEAEPRGILLIKSIQTFSIIPLCFNVLNFINTARIIDMSSLYDEVERENLEYQTQKKLFPEDYIF